MKGKFFITLGVALTAISASAQTVTYNHDAAKMNQITVAEIGSGALTPDAYYSLLHSNYASSAAEKNKLGFRTLAAIALYQQVDDAMNLDSALIKRAEVEVLNIADRTVDLAWATEGNKLDSKMSDFKSNIQRISTIGGSSDELSYWNDYYKVYESAINATKSAYMPNSQRKKQYLQIYADVQQKNETLIAYLVKLSNRKQTAALLNATYSKTDVRQSAAGTALTKWQQASKNK
jgi:hypothetical protein